MRVASRRGPVSYFVSGPQFVSDLFPVESRWPSLFLGSRRRHSCGSHPARCPGSRARDAESPRQNPRTSSFPLRLTTSRAPVPRYRYRATAIRAAAAYSRIHFHIADITDRDIPSRTSHFARESTLVQASDLAGCCESHCDNHDASHTRGALRSSIVALATLSNQRFACLRSLGMALKPLAYESPRLKHAH